MKGLTSKIVLPALAAVLSVIACGGSSSPATTAGSGSGRSCSGVAGAHHAYVEVADQGAVIARACVGFDSATIDGPTLMKRSGIQWATQTDPKLGLEVCQIDRVPAHFSSCFGDFYWGEWTWSAGAWSAAQVGISQLKVSDHQSLGWVWTSSTATAPPAPPAPPPF